MAFKFSSFLQKKYHRLLVEAFMKVAECNEHNHKRLENVGYSFLKFSLTDYCFHMKANLSLKERSEYRKNRMRDSNLAKLGKEYDIDHMMSTTEWLPEKYKNVMHANGDDKNYSEISRCNKDISDKQIASCVKALIGTYLIFQGSLQTRKFMESMGMQVSIQFQDFPKLNKEHEKIIETIYHEKKFKVLEEKLKYTFKNRFLLLQAFTHFSYKHSSIIGNYKLLELYGDSVLDYVITRYFFDYEMVYSCEILTNLRSTLTNNTIFASLSKEINLNEYFLWNNKYRVPENCKIHANLFESLAAAVYLDSGMNLSKTRKVFFDLMSSAIDDAIHDVSLMPIQLLMENYKPWKIENEIRGNVFIVNIFCNNKSFVGKGNSLLSAKNDAARNALKYFEELKCFLQYFK